MITTSDVKKYDKFLCASCRDKIVDLYKEIGSIGVAKSFFGDKKLLKCFSGCLCNNCKTLLLKNLRGDGVLK